MGIDVERIERVERELEEFKDDTPTFADLGVDGLLLVRAPLLPPPPAAPPPQHCNGHTSPAHHAYNRCTVGP